MAVVVLPIVLLASVGFAIVVFASVSFAFIILASVGSAFVIPASVGFAFVPLAIVVSKIIVLAFVVVRWIVLLPFAVIRWIVLFPFVVVRTVLNALWTSLLYCLGFRQQGVQRGMPCVPIHGLYDVADARCGSVQTPTLPVISRRGMVGTYRATRRLHSSSRTGRGMQVDTAPSMGRGLRVGSSG
jgi:hypothetical protein